MGEAKTLSAVLYIKALNTYPMPVSHSHLILSQIQGERFCGNWLLVSKETIDLKMTNQTYWAEFLHVGGDIVFSRRLRKSCGGLRKAKGRFFPVIFFLEIHPFILCWQPSSGRFQGKWSLGDELLGLHQGIICMRVLNPRTDTFPSLFGLSLVKMNNINSVLTHKGIKSK